MSREPVFGLAPRLAVEVLTKHNTPQEMERKLRDYLAAGVREVWYVDPQAQEVRVYDAVDRFKVTCSDGILQASSLHAGFQLELKRLVAEPGQSAGARGTLSISTL